MLLVHKIIGGKHAGAENLLWSEWQCHNSQPTPLMALTIMASQTDKLPHVTSKCCP